MNSGKAGATAASSMHHMGIDETIEAWRKRGADRFDPVRFRFIEALVRRAAAHAGHARRILDDKASTLLAAYGGDFERAQRAQTQTDNTTARPPCAAAPEGRPTRGGLAELLEHISRHGQNHGGSPALSDVAPELRTLRYFRSTWSRLSADRRLTQSSATVPENAGPLNSHHLVHRSLTLMRQLSPEYLNLFMSYVDALLWLDQAHGAGALAGKKVPGTETERKPARGRSR